MVLERRELNKGSLNLINIEIPAVEDKTNSLINIDGYKEKLSDYIERIPQEQFCTRQLWNKQGQMCAIGHIINYTAPKRLRYRAYAYFHDTFPELKHLDLEFDQDALCFGIEKAKAVVVQKLREAGL